MLTAIYAILIFCFLIFIHEFGHFITAKACGVPVHEFSLGMGPKILQFGRGETRYSLRAFPIGGYVQMEGEDEDTDDPRSFQKKKTWQKCLIVAAGALMNVLAAIVLVVALFVYIGTPSTTLGAVLPDGPAAAAGLAAGDRILEIDGVRMEEWMDISAAINASEGAPIRLLVERDGSTLNFSLQAAFNETEQRWLLGINTKVAHSFPVALREGLRSCGSMSLLMVKAFATLFSGGGSINDVVGPVGIVSVIHSQAALGLIYIINLTAVISLNLAIVNLLPLPALDGGRLLFLILGGISGHPLSAETEGRIHYAGMLLLLAFMVFLIFHDVGRFILHT